MNCKELSAAYKLNCLKATVQRNKKFQILKEKYLYFSHKKNK